MPEPTFARCALSLPTRQCWPQLVAGDRGPGGGLGLVRRAGGADDAGGWAQARTRRYLCSSWSPARPPPARQLLRGHWPTARRIWSATTPMSGWPQPARTLAAEPAHLQLGVLAPAARRRPAVGAAGHHAVVPVPAAPGTLVRVAARRSTLECRAHRHHQPGGGWHAPSAAALDRCEPHAAGAPVLLDRLVRWAYHRSSA
jgi:hypothetical protein